ncbi:MAG: hypothetical protein HZC40_09250 [Chloroflexi bacterium]|nr:hypothetical protein [Chloroflexota bacterium]
MNPRSIFFTRLWAFLNYRTRLGLTWLEMLTASGVGLMLVWVGLRDARAFTFVAPLAVYLLALGFYRELRIPVDGLRAVYRALFKPLDVKPARGVTLLAFVLGLIAIAIAIGLWFADVRVALLFIIASTMSAILLWAIHERETQGGILKLDTVAARVPVREILKDGELLSREATRARVSIITLGRTGFKPALNAADVADMLTRFLAYLAQHEEGGLPIEIFWLTDYHLGQLDLEASGTSADEYLRELRALAESGARRARVILTGIVYPAHVEPRVREWLAQLDFNISPLGAFAAESLLRMLFGGESFLAQIQEAVIANDGKLPATAYRGFVPEQIKFDHRLRTNRNVLTVSLVNTPFPDARDALMRALHAVDGMVTISITPLPRETIATELRGQMLAARVPGLGRDAEAQSLREILHKIEDRRGLEYLFDTKTYFITWGKDEKSAQTNQTLAESYLTALSMTPLAGRALEDEFEGWMPVFTIPRPKNVFTRWMNDLVLPPRAPGQRLLSAEAITTLANEEGSDIYLADARNRILLGRSVMPGKEGLRYADFRSDTGPVLLVSDQGGGKTSTLIVWFILRLQLLNYKIVAVNLKYSTRMQAAVEKIGGIVLHPHDDLNKFAEETRQALFADGAVIYQPVKGTRAMPLADDPCLRVFMQIFYEEWLPNRDTPAALVMDEIHRLMPKDAPLSESAAHVATLVAEAFKDWAERKLVIAAATQTVRDLLGSNLGIALQKFRAVAYFQVGPEDREMLIEKGYEPALIDLIIGGRRRARGYCVLVMPDGFFTTVKILVTDDEREIIQRLDVEETADETPQLSFR